MYKLVIYDMDGTLVNSLDDLADAMNSALVSVDLKPYENSEYRYFVGQGVANLVKDTIAKQGGNPELASEVKRMFDTVYAKGSLNKTRPYSGMNGTLLKLQQLGIKQAVLSNKPQQFIEDIAAKLFPEIKFDALWGKKPQFDIKPNPASLLAMIEMLGMDKKDCLYVGDSNVDVFTAKNAEISFCGAAWGFRGEEELKSAGALSVAQNAEELLEFVVNE